MNRFINKIVIYITMITIFISNSTITFAVGNSTIHERISTENVSSGVVHENIQKFTFDGWLNINILRVDLDDKYTEVDTIFSSKGVSSKDKLTTMMKDSSAVAGINGDFFWKTNNYYPIGTLIKNGEFISTPDYVPNEKAVLSINDEKVSSIAYWTANIRAITENGQVIKIVSKNKDNSLYGDVCMYDKNWNDKTLGNTIYTDMVEIIVVGNKVSEIRDAQEPTDMPEEGYILVGRNNAKNVLLNNFKIGDSVKIEVDTTPNFENIKTAIGGGTILVENGQVANFTHNIKGKHPRTAIGISEDKDELIMVTIDGRDASFKGVTQETLAKIMIEYGAYSAMNLDGGGSTTMAIAPLEAENSFEILNLPSDGSERRIINGVGVFNNAPQRSLSYIEVYTDDPNMFANTTRKFYIKGYDKYHNPVKVDITEAEFKIEGIEGKFKGNILTANEKGLGMVSVKYKRKKAEFKINVLDKVKDIDFENDRIHVDFEDELKIENVIGKNDEGYIAKIEPEDIDWEITGDIGRIDDNIFHSSDKSSFGALTASVGDAVGNIVVSVGYESEVIEDFESIENIEFSSYPEAVTGSVERENIDKEGKYSIKLNYDFTQTDDTRAAYINLNSDGILLKDKPDKIGMWVYGNESNHWIRGKIVDSENNVYKLDFANQVDWNGWKWIVADVPSNVSYPITLEHLYLVESNSINKDKGEILFDGLKALYSTTFDDMMILPGETVVTDQMNKHVELQEGGYRFVVTPEVEKLDNLLKYHISKRIKNKIDMTDIGLIMGSMNDEFTNEISKPIIEIEEGYSEISHKNTLFIKVDDTKHGIRATNPEQWMWLKNKLSSSNEKNVVLLLPKPIFGDNGFTDKLEIELFDEILVEQNDRGRNIFVLYGNNETKIDIKSGIRYIGFNDNNTDKDINIFGLEYMIFTVNDDEISYEILPLFNK